MPAPDEASDAHGEEGPRPVLRRAADTLLDRPALRQGSNQSTWSFRGRLIYLFFKPGVPERRPLRRPGRRSGAGRRPVAPRLQTGRRRRRLAAGTAAPARRPTAAL